MGDRVAVMRKGELQQVAPPQELYDRPVNVFVGGFIGSPAMNMLEARIERRGRRPSPSSARRHAARDSTTRRSRGIRRCELRRAARSCSGSGRRISTTRRSRTATAPRLRGQVEMREALGSEVLVHFTIAARQAVTDDVRELAEDVGDDRASRSCRRARRDARRAVQPGTRVGRATRVEVVVDQRALHFFDPETGLALSDARERETPSPARARPPGRQRLLVYGDQSLINRSHQPSHADELKRPVEPLTAAAEYDGDGRAGEQTRASSPTSARPSPYPSPRAGTPASPSRTCSAPARTREARPRRSRLAGSASVKRPESLHVDVRQLRERGDAVAPRRVLGRIARRLGDMVEDEAQPGMPPHRLDRRRQLARAHEQVVDEPRLADGREAALDVVAQQPLGIGLVVHGCRTPTSGPSSSASCAATSPVRSTQPTTPSTNGVGAAIASSSRVSSSDARLHDDRAR